MGLPKSFWETYSSFGNTSGGTIYLGIEEGKKENKIAGVKDVDKLKKDILLTSRNKTKVSLSLIEDSDIVSFNEGGAVVLAIEIKEAPRNAKPVYLNGEIASSYIRLGDGDQKATYNEIRSMMMDNAGEDLDYMANEKDYGINEVDKQTLKRFRQAFALAHPNNIFSCHSDEEFLKDICALIPNKNGRYVLTNGALLMFGSYFTITSIFPSFYLDYREASSLNEKWVNRICADDLSWSGNVYDFYSLVYRPLSPYMPKPYRLEGDQDLGANPGQEILREALANSLSNFAVHLSGGVVILNAGSRLTFRNSGRMKVGLDQAKKDGISNPRNTQILNFFRLIGISDKAGTGIPKIYSLAKSLYLPSPLLGEEGYLEATSMTLFLKPRTDASFSKIEQEIMEYVSLYGDDGCTPKELDEHFSCSRTYVTRGIKSLTEKGFLQCNGLKTNGRKYYFV